VKRLAGVTWIMAVLVVSEMDLARLDTLQRIIERRLTGTAAAQLLGLSRRQVHRLVKAYRAKARPLWSPSGVESPSPGLRFIETPVCR
jgi:Homeodomain-like domain-containing protein